MDNNGIISENQARLLINDPDQLKRPINNIFVPIAQLESLHVLHAYACSGMFKLKQMDVKNAFNQVIKNEIYVTKPPGFIDF